MTNNSTDTSLEEQLAYGRKLLTISPSEDQLLKDIPTRLKQLIFSVCQQFSYPIVDIIPVGSSQRQTYLPGKRDIDIFVRLDTADRSILEKFASQAIPTLANSLKTTFELKYAENPYGVIHYPLPDSKEFIPIDIVVTIWLKDKQDLEKILPLSGMARTPFHMFYLQEHIKGLEEEVRLFKYWTRQKKLYRQSGFTGFISELLIIIFGSFQSIMEQAKTIAALTYDFHGRPVKPLRKKHSSFPMVLMDPVDPNRNAAAGIHGILGTFHMQRFTKLAHESLTQPATLWEEYTLTGNLFNLTITFKEGLSIKNDEEYYSRIIKVLGLIYRALKDQEITVLDAIIDVGSSTLSFITDTVGGGSIKIKGPPSHLEEHAKKFQVTHPDYWVEKGNYWSSKPQLTVQDVILTKIKNSDVLESMHFM